MESLKCNSLVSSKIYFHIYLNHTSQIKEETAYVWEYKVGNNVNIANLVCFLKTWLNTRYSSNSPSSHTLHL